MFSKIVSFITNLVLFSAILQGIHSQYRTDCAVNWGLDPKVWIPCDARCYNPKLGQTCDPERGVCAVGEKKCAAHQYAYECYNPTSQICKNAQVCEIGQEVCGTKCYDSTKQVCFRGILCDIGMKACGGQCYDPASTTKTCKGDMILCEKGENACGWLNSRCFSKSKGQTCLGNGIVCEAGQKYCGECYKPEETDKVCVEGTKLCENGEGVCKGSFGFTWCYKPAEGETCAQKDLSAQLVNYLENN